MNPTITTRRAPHRGAVPIVAILLITVLAIAAISSSASAQTVPDAGEATPTVAQTPIVDEPVDDRSLLPLGIGIAVMALATYLVWGATFLVVLDKSSSRRLGGL